MVHLKRLRAPKSWPLVKRKGLKFIARPMAGPHKLKCCITLNVILKDMLKYAKTTRECKKILNSGVILVNNKIINSHKATIGIFDTIQFTNLAEYYKIFYDRNGKFYLEKVSKEEAEKRLVKIKNKTTIKNNKTQLNLHDGTNILVSKDDYKTGDTIIIKDGRIIKNLKFETGAWVYLTGGKYKGKLGLIEIIENASAVVNGKIKLNINNEKITTNKDFAFVIEKPLAK